MIKVFEIILCMYLKTISPMCPVLHLYVLFITDHFIYWWRNLEHLANTTDLLQITDKLYHSKLYQVHLATGKVELTSLMGKVEREWKRMHK
jgi:hypothetical protein